MTEHLERSTLANELFLKKKHCRMEMLDGKTVEAQHLKQMTRQADQSGSCYIVW